MNKTLKIIGLVTASLAVGVAANASDKALVDALVKKGYLTQEEAHEVGKGCCMTSPYGATHTSSITFGGMVQTQYDYVHTKSKNMDAAAKPSRETMSNFSVRRLKLAVNAQLQDNWSADLVLAGSTNGSNDGNTPKSATLDSFMGVDAAVINWMAMDELTFSFGYDTPAFGLENTGASSEEKTLETSIAGRYFDQGLKVGNTNVGIFAKGTFLDGFYYNAAITRASGTADNGKYVDPHTNTPSLYGRLGYTFTWQEANFDVGADIAHVHGAVSGDTNSNNFKVLAGGLYAKASYKGLNVDSNFMVAKARRAGENFTNAKPWAFVITPSYMITDQYEVVARYSYVQTDKAKLSGDAAYAGAGASIMHPMINTTNLSSPNDAGTATNEIAFKKFHQFYLGGNWYILGNDVKLTVGYDYTMGKDAATSTATFAGNSKSTKFNAHHIGARLQLCF